VATGLDGSVYVAGWSMNDVDFDPGPGVVNYQWFGANDFFLSKFDPDGNLIWSRAWGGPLWDIVHGLAVDSHGCAYLGFEFYGTFDSDPGPGTDIHIGIGKADAGFCKFSSDGDFLWAHTWGSPEGDGGDGVVVDCPGNIYLTGDFSGTIDFDPGPAVDLHASNGERDIFLLKFGPDDEYVWGRTWGSAGSTTESWDKGNGICADQNGNVFVTGFINGTVDLDPGPGECRRVSNGGSDAVLSGFDGDGNFLWGKSWGGTDWDMGFDTIADASGAVYVVGSFRETADFDPATGPDIFVSSGYDDAFVSRFSADGTYCRTGILGDSLRDYAHSVTTDSKGCAIVVGGLWDSIGSIGTSDDLKWKSYGGVIAFILRVP
jgi:hypothetical protein